MDKKQPEDTIRDGMLKATLWRNEGENGPYLSADLARTYRDQNGELQDSRSFSMTDLLRFGRIIDETYGRGREIERTMRVMQERSRENAKAKEAGRGPQSESERREFIEKRTGQMAEPKREPSR